MLKRFSRSHFKLHDASNTKFQFTSLSHCNIARQKVVPLATTFILKPNIKIMSQSLLVYQKIGWVKTLKSWLLVVCQNTW